jgi:small subunit ribosomal protein S20
MPITSSAKKALRASKRKRVFNTRRKHSMLDAIKTVKRLLDDKNVKEAQKALTEAYKAIDKAVKTNFIKKNTGSRRKSRLAKMLKKHAQ